MAGFVPRAVFPTLDSLPRSYYLGHHAAGLAKMRTLLNQIDLLIECRDYRIPLTSRNPMFEDVLADRERIIVYTKRDLASSGDGSQERKTRERLTRLYTPARVCFSDFRSARDILQILNLIRKKSSDSQSLTGSHCMVVGMPNVGKSTLLNALRYKGMHTSKVAITGAQPGVTRKIATSVKIIDGAAAKQPDVYLLDTPGVFIPYVPDADAMLKLALCGSVKDNVIPSFTLADYLLYHINWNDPKVYGEYYGPTNDVMELLNAMARKTGRLQKGGIPDLDGTAMWMVQRWRNGHLGRFMLDDLSAEAIEKYSETVSRSETSLSQARKADKGAMRERARSRKPSPSS